MHGLTNCCVPRARPTDVKDIKLVVNYDMPKTAEDYVHRIGRTARAGARGLAVSFFTSADGRLARQILAILAEAQQPVPAQLQQYAAVAGGGGPRELHHLPTECGHGVLCYICSQYAIGSSSQSRFFKIREGVCALLR